MRRLTKYTKIIKYTHIGAMLFTALLVFLLVPAIGKYSESGNNLITVFVNGTQVGVVNDSSKVDSMILEARKRIAKENDGLVLINYEVVLSGSRVIFGKTDEIEEQGEDETSVFPTAGAYQKIQEYYDEALNQETGAFEFGVTNLDFGENVEVVQAYVDSDKISTLDEAIELVTKDQEKSKIYEVEAGDSLSVIAQKNDTTIDEIIAMNKEIIPDENATIRVGDEIKVNMPEPELSVVRTEQVYYEEEYDEDIQYVDNDSWYTTKSQVLQEPVAGFRKVVADITYRNDEEESRELIYEDVVAQAVAKIVERGTKTPPTYMKPVSGGRLSSGFGKRTAPTKGASTYHEGVDWAVPIGTAVVAASGGQVIRAGWGSGYGYCVYIQHPDGIVTRYGHLSKILVKTGQTVKQGEKIALSGNTGVSSGPHLHFEIRVNGTPVNPLNYLN